MHHASQKRWGTGDYPGDGNNFKNGRQLAARLGLVPRLHSSGGKQKLQGINKRGDQLSAGIVNSWRQGSATSSRTQGVVLGKLVGRGDRTAQP